MSKKLLSKIKDSLFGIGARLVKCTVYQKIFLALSFLSLVGLTVFTFTTANLDFNSDTATANLLAEAMVRDGSLFPSGWTYAQDIWVFFLHQPIALFTLFSDNYLVMHSFSALVFIAMALAACIYFSRKVLHSNAWIVAVPMLFCGFSTEYSYMVFGQCAYLPQVIFLFLTPALFSESFDGELKLKSKRKLAVLLVWLAFLAMSGIRNVQSVGIPLLGAMVLSYFIDNHGKELPVIRRKVGDMLLKCVIVGSSILAGLAIYVLIMQFTRYQAGVIGGLTIATPAEILRRLENILSSFLQIFNVQAGVPLFSVDGILSLVGVVALVFICVVFPILQVRKFKEETPEYRFFLLFSLVHIAEIFVLFLFSTLFLTVRYFLTVQMLLFFIAAHYVYKYVLKDVKLLRTAAVALILVAFTLPQTALHFKDATEYREKFEPKLEITEFLEENGLTYGFATYWHAYSNTVLSDGRVEINGILLEDRLRAYYWLNDAERYGEEAYTGKSFLLLGVDERGIFENSTSYRELFGTPTEILEHAGYVIYVYDYNISGNGFTGING